jgi:ribonuclease HI
MRWAGPSIEQAWKDWCADSSYRRVKSLPLIVAWGVWLARNSSIFKDKTPTPDIIAAQALSILSHFPQEKEEGAIRIPPVVQIDHSLPWDYFDGASQNNNQICGGGAILYLTKTHHFNLSMGLGSGTNNFVELLAMKLLLHFAKEKGINTLQIFGDSMLAINWARKSQQCHHIQLLAILEEIFILLDSFDSISLQHVYRVHNREADALSKDGLQLDYGKWLITEYSDGDHFAYYHRPFNEIPPPLAALP